MFRADASALGEKIFNETIAGVQQDIQKNSAIDLNKNQEYRNIVNGLQPKEVALRYTTRNVSGLNAMSASLNADAAAKQERLNYQSVENITLRTNESYEIGKVNGYQYNRNSCANVEAFVSGRDYGNMSEGKIRGHIWTLPDVKPS
ncbi:MAG: hypothetical protein GY928_04295 [Colwellia sp.]|nr:hypothetical protein [Colwellia sp.]